MGSSLAARNDGPGSVALSRRRRGYESELVQGVDKLPDPAVSVDRIEGEPLAIELVLVADFQGGWLDYLEAATGEEVGEFGI